jgi:serine phosphatase RsbU (regulator of sigma subunit)
MTDINNQRIINFKLFEGFSIDEVENLLRIAHIRDYPAATMLFYEGDLAEAFSIIADGQVEIIKAQGTPEERSLNIVGPGEFLGEMSLLNPDQRRTASARALSDASLLEITKAEFETLLGRQPKFALRLMQEMSQRTRHLERAIIQDLQEKNRRLAQALDELEAAQAQLLEKERLESELALARRIQESSLLKELPQPPGWNIAASWRPARSVSGDFYDFILQPDGELKIILADVSGKGMPAALVVATSRSILRTLAARVESPGELLANANEVLFDEIPANMFVTCFFGVLNLEMGCLRFANAGHCLPLRLTETGPREIRATGMPLGLMPGSFYEEKEVILGCGEQIFLYSDGLLEAHNSQGDMFGSQRIVESLATPLSGKPMIESLLNTLTTFAGEGEQEDDITCVVIGRDR